MNTHFHGRPGTYLKLSAGILSAVLWLPGAATGQTQDAMTLEIPVLPEAQRYVALLEYPRYLAFQWRKYRRRPSG